MTQIIRITAAAALIFTFTGHGEAEILINEISAGGSADWVEIFHNGGEGDRDISVLYVTMYRGTNYPVASSPVTLKPADDPATPFDDRFAVIHFTSETLESETDSAGDINGNGIRDIYCRNYGLWNTDCVVALDTDDDPENGGIIDFVAFSNRDGSINSDIEKYLNCAVSMLAWNKTGSLNPQDWCCFTGSDGLNEWSTLSRIRVSDSNSLADFAVTGFSTPGRENIFINGDSGKIFSVVNTPRVFPMDRPNQRISVNFKIFRKCTIRVRVFNSIGVKIASKGSSDKLFPGFHSLSFTKADFTRPLKTGLCLFHIEAVADKGGTQKKILTFSMVMK